MPVGGGGRHRPLPACSPVGGRVTSRARAALPPGTRRPGSAGGAGRRREIARHAGVLVAALLVAARAAVMGRAADLVLPGRRGVDRGCGGACGPGRGGEGRPVVAVGSDADVAARVGPATRVVELDGRTVTPGLHRRAHPLPGRRLQARQRGPARRGHARGVRPAGRGVRGHGARRDLDHRGRLGPRALGRGAAAPGVGGLAHAGPPGLREPAGRPHGAGQHGRAARRRHRRGRTHARSGRGHDRARRAHGRGRGRLQGRGDGAGRPGDSRSVARPSWTARSRRRRGTRSSGA